jgi:hypothetical protein
VSKRLPDLMVLILVAIFMRHNGADLAISVATWAGAA